MEKEKYIEDLKEIRDIMHRSARFISLSGLSGVWTGVVALAGVFLAYQIVFKDSEYLVHHAVEISKKTLWNLLAIATSTLILSVWGAFFFTYKKTRKRNQSVWNMQTKQLLFNLLIPLITGGVLCLLFLAKGFVGVLPSVTLVFYGLALVNGSKYTLPEIRNLGLIEILIGLIAFQFVAYSLFFWALGFGLVQITYGLIIQRKY